MRNTDGVCCALAPQLVTNGTIEICDADLQRILAIVFYSYVEL